MDTIAEYRSLHRRLTKTQERRLLRKVQQAGPSSDFWRQFLLNNLALIGFVINKYFRNRSWGSLTEQDLIHEGFFGLEKAVKKFNLKFKNRFSTYAVTSIKRAIERAFDEQARTVRIPSHQVEIHTKLVQARDYLSQRGARGISDADVAAWLELSPEDVETTDLAFRLEPVSLNVPIGRDGSLTLEEAIGNEAIADVVVAASSIRAILSQAFQKLTPLERAVITCMFFHDMTLEATADAVAELHGRRLSRERVRQIKNNVLSYLRVSLQ